MARGFVFWKIMERENRFLLFFVVMLHVSLFGWRIVDAEWERWRSLCCGHMYLQATVGVLFGFLLNIHDKMTMQMVNSFHNKNTRINKYQWNTTPRIVSPSEGVCLPFIISYMHSSTFTWIYLAAHAHIFMSLLYTFYACKGRMTTILMNCMYFTFEPYNIYFE